MNYKNQLDRFAAYSCRIELLYADWAKKHGMSYHTLMVLYAIRQLQPCTQKQIVHDWMLRRQTVNTVIKDLEEKGYLVLLAGRNHKEKLISFTEAGEEMTARVLRDILEAEERTLARMGEEASAGMIEGLFRYASVFAEETGYDE